MIRPFDWRDVRLVRALSSHGVCLDSATGLTHGIHPLQRAMMEYLMPGTGAPTLIWRAENGRGKSPLQRAAFGQLIHRSGHELARVLFVAPHWQAAGDSWSTVVDHLAVEAGERGAYNLIAEVDEASADFEGLRTAGFAIYARQSVWQLAEEGARPDPAKTVPLRPAKNSDRLGVNTLFSNIVPRLVQQVEPPPRRISRGFVLEQGSEIIAFMDVRRGPAGVWIEPHLHPEADDLSAAVLHACLGLLPSSGRKPVYVCVRRYQNWLKEVVARAGFEFMQTQAVMVKRLTVRISEPVLRPLTVAEGQVPTPISRVQAGPPADDGQAAAVTGGNLAYWLLSYAKTNHRRPSRVDGRDPARNRVSPQHQ